MSDYVKELQERLGNVIRGTCNTVGCKDCDLKWEENGREMCSAIELQNKIYDQESKGDL